jgi:hypothetical protein
VKLEIRPEPSPAERKAIERALARDLAAAPRLWSAWREAGVRENTKRQPRHPRTFDAGAVDPPDSGRGAAPQ